MTALLTAEELWKRGSAHRAELVDGVLIEMSPAGARHGQVAARLAARLLAHAEPGRLGAVLVETGFTIRRDPDTVRAPNVAFVRRERIPPEGVPASFWELAPDLVVEVVSPNDTAAEVQAKVREWTEAGVRLVWVVYPDRRTVEVIRSLKARQLLSTVDRLEGEEVVPGFSCPVAAVFGEHS